VGVPVLERSDSLLKIHLQRVQENMQELFLSRSELAISLRLSCRFVPVLMNCLFESNGGGVVQQLRART
jgi:hypothetical protein